MTLYRAAVSDDFVTVVMTFLRKAHLKDENVKISLFRFNQNMCENVYMGVLFSLPDEVICFAFEAE